jgi:ATP-dependent Clp protease, protease subunit
MAVIINGNEIVLSGMVGGSASGDSWWDPPGFSAQDVVQALAQVGREANVVIRLNSGGGIATEGAAIHAALAQHKGTVQIVVEGIAASAASVIAMAADTLTMALGSVLMIHEPAMVTLGDAAAHEQSIVLLNAMGDAYAEVYADRTGKPAEEMRALMKAESWMTATQAVAEGFADAVGSANDNDAQIEPTAFAYGAYRHAPDQLVALANAKGWKPRAVMTAPAVPPVTMEATLMTDLTAAGDPAVEDEALTTAAEPGIDPPVETPDVVAIAAVCASECRMSVEQIREFTAAGGTLEQAKARAAEITAIDEDIARAKRINPAVSLSVADAVSRGLSPAQVKSELWPQVTSQAEISPQAPPPAAPAKPEDPMVAAAERLNAQMARYSGRR